MEFGRENVIIDGEVDLDKQDDECEFIGYGSVANHVDQDA